MLSWFISPMNKGGWIYHRWRLCLDTAQRKRWLKLLVDSPVPVPLVLYHGSLCME